MRCLPWKNPSCVCVSELQISGWVASRGQGGQGGRCRGGGSCAREQCSVLPSLPHTRTQEREG